jgi:urease gamma subunit
MLVYYALKCKKMVKRVIARTSKRGHRGLKLNIDYILTYYTSVVVQWFARGTRSEGRIMAYGIGH